MYSMLHRPGAFCLLFGQRVVVVLLRVLQLLRMLALVRLFVPFNLALLIRAAAIDRREHVSHSKQAAPVPPPQRVEDGLASHLGNSLAGLVPLPASCCGTTLVRPFELSRTRGQQPAKPKPCVFDELHYCRQAPSESAGGFRILRTLAPTGQER